MVREDPMHTGLLYAVTEPGMYGFYNVHADCKPFQLNLPIVPITDLAVKDNNLIVATQGRSLWIIDDLTVLHQLNEAKKNTSTILYKPKDKPLLNASKTPLVRDH